MSRPKKSKRKPKSRHQTISLDYNKIFLKINNYIISILYKIIIMVSKTQKKYIGSGKSFKGKTTRREYETLIEEVYKH